MAGRETGRSILRAAAVRSLIDAQTIAADRVYPTRVWPMQQGQMPAYLVYVYNEESESLDLTSPDAHFRTTLDLLILARAEAIATDIEDQIDTLVEQAKNALFTNCAFRDLVNWFAGMRTELTYGDTDRLPYAEAAITIKCVYNEPFAANITTNFAGADIYVDAASVAVDPTGEYTPPFPYPVQPAPRTRGPDGRIEIGAKD